jgi:hypothetical protein
VVVDLVVLLTEGGRSEVEDLFVGGSAEYFPKVGWVSSGWGDARVTYVQE